jgi:hypothetical protein
MDVVRKEGSESSFPDRALSLSVRSAIVVGRVTLIGAVSNSPEQRQCIHCLTHSHEGVFHIETPFPPFWTVFVFEYSFTSFQQGC